MQRLSDLDASFLYLETERTPMLVGGIYIFDAENRTNPMSFAEFYQFVQSRLPAARFFRQRLVEVPLKFDHPYWVDDAHFDLSQHLERKTLPQGSTQEDLMKLAADTYSHPLHRDRPLWAITFVDGLEAIEDLNEHCFAIIIRMSHVVVDAFNGEGVMHALLDFTESPRPIKEKAPWNPEPLPNSLKLLNESYSHAFSTPARLINFTKDTLASSFYKLLLQRLHKLNLPLSLFSAPRTLFNNALTQHRKIDFFEVPLDRIKDIKNSIGDVTVNDVITGICAEALHHCLKDANDLPSASLIGMSPISVRSKNLATKTGNQLSAMLIELATNIDNPIQRIRKINRNAVVSDTYRQAIAADRLTELIPSSVAALSARIYTEFQLAQRHKPLFNVPITNIPGPQKPLYLNGAKLIRQIGTMPLFDGIGLALIFVSYNGKVTISVTSCASLMTNTRSFTEYLEDAFKSIEGSLNAPESLSPSEEVDTEVRTEIVEFPETNKESALKLGSGMIEDVVALFQNLFASILPGKVDQEKPASSSKTQPATKKKDNIKE
jgi:WS/DGAT/MGAT family acyltransferase